MWKPLCSICGVGSVSGVGSVALKVFIIIVLLKKKHPYQISKVVDTCLSFLEAHVSYTVGSTYVSHYLPLKALSNIGVLDRDLSA